MEEIVLDARGLPPADINALFQRMGRGEAGIIRTVGSGQRVELEDDEDEDDEDADEDEEEEEDEEDDEDEESNANKEEDKEDEVPKYPFSSFSTYFHLAQVRALRGAPYDPLLFTHSERGLRWLLPTGELAANLRYLISSGSALEDFPKSIDEDNRDKIEHLCSRRF